MAEERPYKCNLIQAGSWDEDFQEYYYEDGQRVPEGEDIGVEIDTGIETQLFLLEGIYYPGEKC